MSKLITRVVSFLTATFIATSVQAADPVKVVYHVMDTDSQAMLALGNIRNHLRADPSVKIVVVALYKGIDFMISGKTDAKGNPWSQRVEDLAAAGVDFRVCRNTMDFFKVTPDMLLSEARMVPSGVAEIARLQAQEGYVYIKP
jgi:intracellular sulfur oxidation DsrE/DsrF family protein